ncbi:uncharacterized protein LOC116298402 isoform X2 [Actinia tenebrosa]|nr:uncharacterized protein LOC116298402 isoform X2 [Actinia tenebrosa]
MASIPEFHKGKTYYFIDTSSGTENTVNNRNGGRCKTHNMRMKIYVCTNFSDPKCPHGNEVVNGGWSPWQECKFGNQSRHCNNPSPANGGYPCEGNSSQSCTSIKPTQPSTINNYTSGNKNYSYAFTPERGRRTSVADTLGTLSVGAVVAIFLVIFIVGCVLGLIVGVLGTHKKLKQFVVKRRPARSNNNANRNSCASTAHFRPTSFASILTTSTGITNFDPPVENDNYEAAESSII